jgi:hypothetical protein
MRHWQLSLLLLLFLLLMVIISIRCLGLGSSLCLSG